MSIEKKPVGGPVKLPIVIFAGIYVVMMISLPFRTGITFSGESLWRAAIVPLTSVAVLLGALVCVGYWVMRAQRSVLASDIAHTASSYGVTMTRTASFQRLLKENVRIGGVSMRGRATLFISVMSNSDGLVLMTGPHKRRFAAARIPWSAVVAVEAGYIENTINVLRGIRITAMSDDKPVHLDFQSYGAGLIGAFPLPMERVEEIVGRLLVQQQSLGVEGSPSVE